MFEAKYPGKCNECEERIEPGELVRYDESEQGKVLVHEHHAEEMGEWSGVHQYARRGPRSAGAQERATKYQGTTLDEMGY